MTTSQTPRTKRESYQELKDSGEDVSLRRQVAAAIAEQPDTTSGLSRRFPEHSSNAIRPRVNELLRMGCVVRNGTRTNPSGQDAYLHELTERGRRYLDGEIEPTPGDTVAEHAKRVVSIARAVVTDDADTADLETAVADHDATKARLDPDFDSPFVPDDEPDDDPDPEPPSIGEAIRDVIENTDAERNPTREELIDEVTALVESDRDAVAQHIDGAERQGFLYVADGEVGLP